MRGSDTSDFAHFSSLQTSLCISAFVSVASGYFFIFTSSFIEEDRRRAELVTNGLFFFQILAKKFFFKFLVKIFLNFFLRNNSRFCAFSNRNWSGWGIERKFVGERRIARRRGIFSAELIFEFVQIFQIFCFKFILNLNWFYFLFNFFIFYLIWIQIF